MHVRGWAPHEEAVPPRGRRAVGTRVRHREEKICNVVAASLQPDLDTSQLLSRRLFPAMPVPSSCHVCCHRR